MLAFVQLEVLSLPAKAPCACIEAVATHALATAPEASQDMLQTGGHMQVQYAAQNCPQTHMCTDSLLTNALLSQEPGLDA